MPIIWDPPHKLVNTWKGISSFFVLRKRDLFYNDFVFNVLFIEVPYMFLLMLNDPYSILDASLYLKTYFSTFFQFPILKLIE